MTPAATYDDVFVSLDNGIRTVHNVPVRCPRCAADMERSLRQGVEVDYCTRCLGVWFDRGEVERVFNRLTAVHPEDLPQQWEPVDHELAPALFTELVELHPHARP